MSEARTAFVTGGSGFVGRRVVQTLCDAGWRVRALVHETPLEHGVPAAVEPIDGNLRDTEGLGTALEGVDAIAHCAALLAPVRSAEDADAVNHRATADLARAGRRANVGSFVFVSSIAAVGFRRDAGLVRPDAPCDPSTPYGRSKRDAERALLPMSDDSFRVCVLRPPTLYGPGDQRNFLALTRAVDGGVFPMPGGGGNRMSFCHVDNLAQAVLWAVRAPRARGIVHVADERPVTLRETVDAIGHAIGKRPLSPSLPMPLAHLLAIACEAGFGAFGATPPLSRERLGTITADCALDTRETRRLGFEPSVGFADGLTETVRWYREEGFLRARSAP